MAPGTTRAAARPPGGDAEAPLAYECSRVPLAAAEQARFVDDLAELGLDGTVWRVLNATLATGSPASKPLFVRARRDGALVGAALVVECRRLARCVTRNPVLERTIDALSPTSFMWLRLGAGIDHYANPGFVAGGLDRATFVRGAVAALMRRYAFGCVFDAPETSLGVATADVPFVDFGGVDLAVADRGAFLAESKQLRKKVRKFGNKGGRIETVVGPMPDDELGTVVGWLRSLDPEIRLAFQDLYPSMVDASNRLRDTVHVLAYLDDAFVGYHSFVRSGERLVCLSGVFDSARPSNYHAYENVLLEAVQHASDRGLAHVDFGPIVNPTKAKLMTRFERSALRYVSRIPALRAAMRATVARSRIGPAALGRYRGLEATRSEGAGPPS